MTVARRLDEVLSVEAGSILARGHVAADEGMAIVSDMINGFLQLEAALAEHLSNQPSTTAVELSFNARNLGILLLPTLLECTLAGITKCWDCDWGILGRQLQALHDLVLKKPLLDHAAMALLQLIWLRAPMLLPAEEKGRGKARTGGVQGLSQEIHDTLVVEGMEQANAEEIQLMAHVRREVLQHLGQSGRWQPEQGKLESGQVSEPPDVPKKRPSANRQSSPKKRRTSDQQIVPVRAQEIESFMAALLDKFGCEPLVGSFMERVEMKAMAAMTLAATKGFTKEAKEASDAALAAEKIADVMMNFQILLGFGTEAKQAIVDQLPQLVRHLLETSSWPDCWRHALCDMLELVIHQKLARESSASLWDQVGQKWLEHANASRLTAVGSLATVLAGVLAQMPDAKAAESLKCMENLRFSAASCLICFQKADPQKTLDGKLAFSDMSSAEEESSKSPSVPRLGVKILAGFVGALGCGLVLAACFWTHSSRPDMLPRGLAPGRELYDVNYFEDDQGNVLYSSNPEENKVVKTTCVIDAVQAASYIGEAVTNIYRAEICPDDEPLGCTAPVAHAVTAILWVMSFITSATSTCAETINYGTSCAAAILRDLATAGSTIYGFDEDCFLTRPFVNNRVFQPPRPKFLVDHGRRLGQAGSDARAVGLYRNKSAELQRLLKETTSKHPDHEHAALPNVLFDAASHGLPRSALDSTFQKIKAIHRHGNRKTERNFALANCVFDSVDAVGWLMRALLSINEASHSCDDPKVCTVDVVYVLGALAYCAQMLSLAFVDCPQYGKREALCGADVTDVVGSMAIFVASTVQAVAYCDLGAR
ncbi:unnamed protein product [Symbiodinium necroappetens]|uniref:Uncharacterized protein n=1 Tax=Symbiodinium necroappetens TaxID=1628268 RepID=A0A812LLK0_9DINO|nr:unnamed protein product [Symbiodinium necroappetens]